MKQDLFQRAKESYQNAILFYQAKRKDDFYRYLGYAEALEYVLKSNFILTEEEIKQIYALSAICEEYDV